MASEWCVECLDGSFCGHQKVISDQGPPVRLKKTVAAYRDWAIMVRHLLARILTFFIQPPGWSSPGKPALIRHLGEIPGWRFLQRPIRPFHLALTLSCIALGWIEFLDLTPLARTQQGDAIGLVCFIAAFLLTYGWWKLNDRVAEWGLTLATGVWAARSTLVILTGTATFGTVWLTSLLSWAWTIGSGGAWLLEAADRKYREQRQAVIEGAK